MYLNGDKNLYLNILHLTCYTLFLDHNPIIFLGGGSILASLRALAKLGVAADVGPLSPFGHCTVRATQLNLTSL